MEATLTVIKKEFIRLINMMNSINYSGESTSDSVVKQLESLVSALKLKNDYNRHQALLERTKIYSKVGEFDYKNSRPWKYFVSKGWDQMSSQEILLVGRVISEATNIPLDRESKRRKRLLFNWFNNNWDRFYPIMEHLHLDFGQTI